jgi:hypothetical protein
MNVVGRWHSPCVTEMVPGRRRSGGALLVVHGVESRELRSDRIAVRVWLNPRVDGLRGPGEPALFWFESGRFAARL